MKLCHVFPCILSKYFLVSNEKCLWKYFLFIWELCPWQWLESEFLKCQIQTAADFEKWLVFKFNTWHIYIFLILLFYPFFSGWTEATGEFKARCYHYCFISQGKKFWTHWSASDSMKNTENYLLSKTSTWVSLLCFMPPPLCVVECFNCLLYLLYVGCDA